MGDQRQQTVHHEFRHRHHFSLHDHSPYRHQRQWQARDLGHRGAYWHASDTHPLTFTDVRVPEDHLLGERGEGYQEFLSILDGGRVAIAALALGCIRACLELSTQYATQRTTFGVPIGRKQGIAFQIADLDVMAAAAHQLV